MEFKITGTNVPVSNVYDNEGAHNQIKLMMQKGEILTIHVHGLNHPEWQDSNIN